MCSRAAVPLLICVICWCRLFSQAETHELVFLTGIVSDFQTGERLPFAHVTLQGTSRGAVCDSEGSFSLELEPGRYRVVTSYVGYQSNMIDSLWLGGKDTVRLDIRLVLSSAVSSEVFITASQRSQHIHLAPASLGVVTAAELSERQISTFDKAFDQITGVEVTRSGGTNVQGFSIRGASEVAGGGTGSRVLLLIDGRPAISPESGGALWNLVPLSSIDHVEVVKGPYSSLYGSSAMGGVVNVITRRPSTDPVTHINVNFGFYNKAPASSGYTRFGDFNTISYSRSHVRGKFSYLFDLARKQDDGYREKSAYTLYNGFTKMQYDLSNQRSIQFSLNLNKIHNDTPGTWVSFSKPYTVADYKQDDYQDRREWNADLQYHAIAGARTKYDSRFYFYDNFSEFSFNDDPDNDSTNVNIGKQFVSENSIRARRLGNVSQVDLALGDVHYLIGGVDVKYDWIDGRPDTVLYGMHQAFSIGGYVQDEMTFGRYILTAGIRYDYFHILSEFIESNVSPKLAMVYSVNKNIAIRALLAQAFRNPSMAERFIKFEQGGGLRFDPNPNLRAEKLTFSTELGARIDLTSRVQLDLAGFYNRYKDLISFVQVSAPLQPLTFRVVNLNKAVMQGFEGNIRYQVPGYCNLSVGYTLLDARDASPARFNDALAYKIRHTFQFSTTGYYKSFTLNVSGRYRSAVEEVFIYPGSEPDANFLLHSKLAYKLADRHSIYVAVNNLTNTQYEELERYRMPGRSYTAGAQFTF